MRDDGGYQNTAFDSASFMITVRVNEHTPRDSAEAFLRRRAAEVCTEQHFSGFTILESTRAFERKVRWTGIGQGELAYGLRLDAAVRCTSAR